MHFSARNIVVHRGGRNVLDDVSVDVWAGEISVVTGPNGAGKSTLVSALAGYIPCQRGTICIGDHEVTQLSTQELSERRAVMTQASNVVFDFSVSEILAMGVPSAVHSVENLREVDLELAAECDISELLHRKFNSLSGGERQRVQFCRALIQIARNKSSTEPRYLILDEPTSSLDLYHVVNLTKILKRVRAGNVGILVVLHDLNLTAYIADFVVLLKDGEVAGAGAPSDVFTGTLLSDVYSTPVSVERRDDRPLIFSY